MARYTAVLTWVQHMLWPRMNAGFEPWASLEATLMPSLERADCLQWLKS